MGIITRVDTAFKLARPPFAAGPDFWWQSNGKCWKVNSGILTGSMNRHFSVFGNTIQQAGDDPVSYVKCWHWNCVFAVERQDQWIIRMTLSIMTAMHTVRCSAPLFICHKSSIYIEAHTANSSGVTNSLDSDMPTLNTPSILRLVVNVQGFELHAQSLTITYNTNIILSSIWASYVTSTHSIGRWHLIQT